MPSHDISVQGITKISVEIQTGRVKTNRWQVSSNYTTYILVSPSCNIPTNNIWYDWSHQLHCAGLHEILIPTISWDQVFKDTRILQKVISDQGCHKLHSAISPSILRRFSRSQWLRKALKKTFISILVTPRSNQ